MNLFEQLSYFLVIPVLFAGLAAVVLYKNISRKLLGVIIIQASIVLLYINIWMSIDSEFHELHLPPVLLFIVILLTITTIVWGFTLVKRIKKAYPSDNEYEILNADRQGP